MNGTTVSSVGYAYDAMGRFLLRTAPDGTMVCYYYDGMNTLLERGRYWNDFYEEWQWRTARAYTLAQAAIGQIAGERTMMAWHYKTGAPTAWSDRWYHYDMLGNVTGELDASGIVQSHVWMEAFGTVMSGGQAGRRLTTKTYDADAQAVWFGTVWYFSHTGRLNRPGSPYSFAHNNPANYHAVASAVVNHLPGVGDHICGILASIPGIIEDGGNPRMHCLWNCFMARSCGSGTARILSQEKEVLDFVLCAMGKQEWCDSAGQASDQRDNAAGRRGQFCPEKTCYEPCDDEGIPVGTAEGPGTKRPFGPLGNPPGPLASMARHCAAVIPVKVLLA